MNFNGSPSLRAIATSAPPNVITQSEALEYASQVFGAFEEFDRLRAVFPNTGIETRRTAMPVEWYLQPRDLRARTDVYLETALDLYCEAANHALERAGLTACEIDTVVTVSSSGIATPTLDARALDRLGLRSRVERVPLFGLGCAGGAMGLSLASRLAAGTDGSNVLVVVVELCSLAFRGDQPTAANVVATALFGDGAAAAVIAPSRDNDAVRINRGFEHTWVNTLGIMGWNIDANGFEVVFDRAIPPFARRHLKPVIEGFLCDLDISLAETARLCFHPGGTRVLQAIEKAFSMQTGTLDIERDVLREYGNMSAPTALFVLDRALQTPMRGTSLISALGPGFTAASVPVCVMH